MLHDLFAKYEMSKLNVIHFMFECNYQFTFYLKICSFRYTCTHLSIISSSDVYIEFSKDSSIKSYK